MERIQQGLEKFKQRQKGFTLVELIVVIAIIGILAAVLLPRYFGFTDDARKNACLSEAKNISALCQTYYAKWGEMPDIAEGTINDPTKPSTITLTEDDPATVYTFNGAIKKDASFSSNGQFEYVKNNGTAAVADEDTLWKATCGSSGEITVELNK